MYSWRRRGWAMVPGEGERCFRGTVWVVDGSLSCSSPVQASHFGTKCSGLPLPLPEHALCLQSIFLLHRVVLVYHQHSSSFKTTLLNGTSFFSYSSSKTIGSHIHYWGKCKFRIRDEVTQHTYSYKLSGASKNFCYHLDQSEDDLSDLCVYHGNLCTG